MKSQKLKRPYSSLIKFLCLAFALGFSFGLRAQEFPAFLRSNYIAKPLVTTKSNDFGLAPMTREYIVFCSNGRKGISRLIREDKIDLFLYNLKTNEVSAFDKTGLCDLESVKYNIGSVSFSGDLKTMLISRNRFEKNFEGVLPFELLQVDINEASSECSLLPFINPDFSYQQPFFDTRQNVLFYVSNEPGGKGGYDIYYCVRKGTHLWSEPQNLDVVNSPGDELFPSVDSYGNIYFSRYIEGRGLEIFCLVKGSNVPQALPGPFNTEGDDFNFIVVDTKNILLSRVLRKNKSSDIILYSIQ